MKKIIRISTVPLSLRMFCLDLFDELRDSYHLLAVSSPGADLEEVARRGTPVRAVRMERQISMWHDMRSLLALVRLFRKERPDMVHSITPKAGLLSMVAAWITRVPVRLHSFTGLVFPTATGLKRLVLMTTDSITCACATHIHAEGVGVRSDLLGSGITKKDVTVLHHGNIKGVDLFKFRTDEVMAEKAASIKKAFSITDESFIFIFVGRVAKDKGIVELVDAFGALRKDGYNVSLLLIGVLDESDPLPKTTLDAIEADPMIHFTDSWVEDVRPYYIAADALVFPSYREGFPNVVLEAGAFSLPSIVTDINGSREIISDGVNGLTVPPRDSFALFSAMRLMLDHPEMLSGMGLNARAVIEEKFDARDIRDALKKYYSDILSLRKEVNS